MRILLINPPYRAITIRGMGPQVPLGLLTIGGPLIDAGYEVCLLNAEEPQLADAEIVALVRAFTPDVVMTGHSGSTPAHPTVLKMLAAIKAALPGLLTVYGGVYPTYHARDILEGSPQVDIIVRGEWRSDWPRRCLPAAPWPWWRASPSAIRTKASSRRRRRQ